MPGLTVRLLPSATNLRVLEPLFGCSTRHVSYGRSLLNADTAADVGQWIGSTVLAAAAAVAYRRHAVTCRIRYLLSMTSQVIGRRNQSGQVKDPARALQQLAGSHLPAGGPAAAAAARKYICPT